MKALSAFLTFFLFLALCPLPSHAKSLSSHNEVTLSSPKMSKTIAEGLAKNVFLDLRNINVIDVLKFLATQGNLNIVTSKNVQGRSTLLLRSVSIRDALDIILLSNQLAVEIKGDIIYVMTEDEYTQLYGQTYSDKRKISTRKLTYVKPAYAVTALQAVQSTVGKVIVNEDTGSVIMIDTPEKLMQMNSLLNEIETKPQTQVVGLQYAKAKDVEAQLKPEIDGKGVGTIYADDRSNQIVVSSYPDRLKEILPVVKALDKQTKAVLIEARILQLTLNPKYDQGIDWEKTFQRFAGRYLQDMDLRGSFPIAESISTATDIGTWGKLGFGNVDATKFALELKTLKEVSDTKTLANPRLMILNREQAKLNIGDTIPYVITTSTGTGNNVSVSEDIKFIDVGLILVVTPTINDNGYITMSIRPEISSQTGTLETPTNNLIPIVNKTFIESTVIVKDGITVILGGLRRDEVSEIKQGFPYLMDIPYLGNLFKSRNEAMTRTEIVILLTPHIITGDKDIVDSRLAINTGASPALNSSGNVAFNPFNAANINTAGLSGASVAAVETGRKIEPFLEPDPLTANARAIEPKQRTS